MTLELRIEPEAGEELEHAALWYDVEQPGLGTEFLDLVVAALERVRQWPEVGPAVQGVVAEVRVRRLTLARFPYSIVYVLHRDAIHVVAIAHNHRRPDYWHDRLASG